MPYRIVRFETTPNPNALKCWLDQPISDRPRSFLNAKAAESDPLAAALFSGAGVTTLLFNGDWLTINKSEVTPWSTVKGQVKKILEQQA